MTKVEILECTLRDGSYTVGYQFTAEYTRTITAALADAGFRYIEIGHGLGLNASSSGKGEAAATDWEYIEAGAHVKGNSFIGMFYIPGIGRSEDIVKARGMGLDFIRVGIDITKAKEADPHIRLAKKLGFFVFCNLLKAYVVETEEFLQKAQEVLDGGADVVVMVDSAGSMLPQDVRRRISSLRDLTDGHIGFHGHNNLQLATANTLAAIESGADFADSTLQGIGRSAGNAQSEVLVAILGKQGYHTGVDRDKVMDIGARLVLPFIKERRGMSDIEVISGIAQFHSGFLPTLERVSRKYRVDLRELITEVSKVERVNVTEKLAEDVAQLMDATKKNNVGLLAEHQSG